MLLGAIGATSLVWPGAHRVSAESRPRFASAAGISAAPAARIRISGLQAPDPHDPMFPHEEHVFFDAYPTNRARQAGHRMVINIVYPPYARPRVRIDVPTSFAVLSGEIFKGGPPTGRETIEVKANRPGLYKIRGSLTLHFADGIDDHVDEQMWEMPVVVTRDSIWAGWTQTTRSDRIDRTGRYRRGDSGGGPLVPIDGPDPFTWHDLRDNGLKPQPTRMVAARWDSCGIKRAVLEMEHAVLEGAAVLEDRDGDGRVDTTVACLVVVDKAGKVMSARCPFFDFDASFRKAIEDAALQWRFRPARLGSRAVNDWTGVPILVRCATSE